MTNQFKIKPSILYQITIGILAIICIYFYLIAPYRSKVSIQGSQDVCDSCMMSPSVESPSLQELGINLHTVWDRPYTIEDQIEDGLVNGFFGNRYTLEWWGCHGDCDYTAIYNVMQIAGDSLWADQIENGKTYHAPCGGGAMCSKPYLTENVRCYVEKTDCDFGDFPKNHDPKVLKTYLLDCRGDVICEDPKDCCLITKTIKGRISHS